jgi:hypothetical protein
MWDDKVVILGEFLRKTTLMLCGFSAMKPA